MIKKIFAHIELESNTGMKQQFDVVSGAEIKLSQVPAKLADIVSDQIAKLSAEALEENAAELKKTKSELAEIVKKHEKENAEIVTQLGLMREELVKARACKSTAESKLAEIIAKNNAEKVVATKVETKTPGVPVVSIAESKHGRKHSR
jgi:hypothetical protein